MHAALGRATARRRTGRPDRVPRAGGPARSGEGSCPPRYRTPEGSPPPPRALQRANAPMSGALDAKLGSAAFQASQGETKTHLESLLGTKLSPRTDDTDNTAPDPNSAVAVAVQKSDGVELDSVSLSLAATPLGLPVVWPRPSLPCRALSAPRRAHAGPGCAARALAPPSPRTRRG